jgi:TonB family protein
MREAMIWAGYCALVSTALAVAALACEGAARATGRATRWSWTAALCGTIVFPLISYLRPVHVQASNGVVFDVSAPAFTAAPQTATVSMWTSHTLMYLWCAISLAVVAYVASAYIALRRARRNWTRAEVQGESVWLSDDVGPAALGVVSADIVLPRWVLSLNARALNLMLLHEREHLRAWDPRLLLAGLLPVVLFPWNPAGWIMVMRLRRAIEFDCDARVLARDPDPVCYGEVLLEVGRRRTNNTLALATFAEPRSHLEERIRRMTQWPGHQKIARATVLGAAAFLLTGAAFAVHSPVRRVVVDPSQHAAVPVAMRSSNATSMESSTLATSPSDTVPPALQNADAISKSLNRNYPALLRDAGIEGRAMVAVLVGADGKVQDRRIVNTSGYPSLDSAAVTVASEMLFTPASSGGKRISAWANAVLQFGIESQMAAMTYPRHAMTIRDAYAKTADDVTAADTTMVLRKRASADAPQVVDTVIHMKRSDRSALTARSYFIPDHPTRDNPAIVDGVPVYQLDEADAAANVMRKRRAADMATDTTAVTYSSMRQTGAEMSVQSDQAKQSDLMTQPVLSPMTTRPGLVNVDAVKTALSDYYPALLRDAGIGGTAIVWLYIDESGRPQKLKINKSSGRIELDRAALRVAGLMQFSPAENMGKIVPVWIQVPITFSSK